MFRLLPENGSLFVRAIVHPSRQAMREDFSASVVSKTERFGARLAYCREVHVLVFTGNRWRRDPCIADVHFSRRNIGTEIVTHELFHASIAWGRRIDFPWMRLGTDDSVNDDEERITYVHGRLCRQFVDRAYRAGLYG